MVYYVSDKLEKKLKGQHAKHYKRYKVLNPIFWIYVPLAIIVTILFSVWLGKSEGSMDVFLLCTIIIPLAAIFFGIPGMIINIVRISGGRDIFLARLNQQIMLNDTELYNAWNPRFRQIEPAELIEYHIKYQDIVQLNYSIKFQRLEIYGKRECVKSKKLYSGESEHIIEDNGSPFFIYNYYNNMEEMMKEISCYTGLAINQIE